MRPDRGSRRLRIDVVSYLTPWVVLLFGISAFQAVPGFGGIGSPALLYTLPALLIWFAGKAVPGIGLDRSPSVTRTVLLVYGWYLLLSYTVAISRPLSPLEQNGAHRALITSAALLGVALLVVDGVDRQDRLETLLRRVVWGGAFMSLIAVAEFFTGESAQPLVPGLVWNHELEVFTRSIFTRPSGTTMHPIELGVVSAALLPLAIHFAIHAPRGRSRQAAVAAAGLIAFAVPISLSRSGVLATVTALAIMFTGWSWRRRANGALVLLGSIPLLWMLVPGLVGSIYGLFSWIGEDTSISARVDRVPAIMTFVRQRPLLGLGHGTWSVEDYFLLDNEVYSTLLATGVIGLGLITALFMTGVLTAFWVKHTAQASAETVSLARSLGAGLAAIGVSLVTFDAFGYRILTNLIFLFIAASAALFRLNRATPETEPAAATDQALRGEA